MMPGTPAAPTNPAVLIVDDHPPNLVALEGVLAPLGARLVSAKSGEEALVRVAEEEFALVLLDLRMPGLSGLETTAIINERHSQGRIPIIILTAYTLESADVRQAYSLGVVDILQKPYLAEVLRTKASIFVELFRQREQLRQQEALLQIQERERFEKELIGIVSHDLRSPLNVITLASTTLIRRGGLDERMSRSLNRIRSSADRATRMIHDLLDYTEARHVQGIPVNPSKADLHQVAEQVVDDLRSEHPGRSIELEIQGSGEGEFDPDRLAQVIVNLASNALRYGQPETAVNIRASGTPDELSLAVHNFGEPIAEEERARLFEPLQRGKPALGRSGRSIGLGLFIVEQIVRAHHGRVEIRSDTEDGTTFTVRIPRTLAGSLPAEV
ncbi:MAG TPA: hybrid sensor histidine kinase/response regulator [Polyangiaceae bacterium]|nr:hybrid sensor histidine kinase/response regulator [Polyangiaceae bacterium]